MINTEWWSQKSKSTQAIWTIYKTLEWGTCD